MGKFYIYVFIFSLILFHFCSPTDSGNNPPKIEKMIANPPSPLTLTDEHVGTLLTVVATDPDGDELEYSWQASGGLLYIDPYYSEGSDIQWLGTNIGTYKITCKVSDGKTTSEASINIEVINE